VSATTKITLNCEDCGAGLAVPKIVDGLPLRRDLEALREHARELYRWRWLRPKGRDHYGDYCEDCADRLNGLARARRVRK
jgi:hypothetical protein